MSSILFFQANMQIRLATLSFDPNLSATEQLSRWRGTPMKTSTPLGQSLITSPAIRKQLASSDERHERNEFPLLDLSCESPSRNPDPLMPYRSSSLAITQPGEAYTSSQFSPDTVIQIHSGVLPTMSNPKPPTSVAPPQSHRSLIVGANMPSNKLSLNSTESCRHEYIAGELDMGKSEGDSQNKGLVSNAGQTRELLSKLVSMNEGDFSHNMELQVFLGRTCETQEADLVETGLDLRVNKIQNDHDIIAEGKSAMLPGEQKLDAAILIDDGEADLVETGLYLRVNKMKTDQDILSEVKPRMLCGENKLDAGILKDGEGRGPDSDLNERAPSSVTDKPSPCTSAPLVSALVTNECSANLSDSVRYDETNEKCISTSVCMRTSPHVLEPNSTSGNEQGDVVSDQSSNEHICSVTCENSEDPDYPSKSCHSSQIPEINDSQGKSCLVLTSEFDQGIVQSITNNQSLPPSTGSPTSLHSSSLTGDTVGGKSQSSTKDIDSSEATLLYYEKDMLAQSPLVKSWISDQAASFRDKLVDPEVPNEKETDKTGSSEMEVKQNTPGCSH